MFSVMAGQRDQPNLGRVSVDVYCIQTSQCILMYSKGDWGKKLVNVSVDRRDCCEGRRTPQFSQEPEERTSSEQSNDASASISTTEGSVQKTIKAELT